MAAKSVLITGCSTGGLGAGMAKVFLEKGFHVFATLRSVAKAGELAELDNVEVLELDVTSRESIKRCAKVVEKRTGGMLDVLVNNAGADFVIPLLDVSVDEAKRLYDTNVWSMIHMVQVFAPLLIKAKGAICNIISTASLLPLVWSSIYSSSKAAAKQISEIMRIELKPLGVRVVTLVAGSAATNCYKNAGELKLPADSYYQQARDAINKIRAGDFPTGNQDAEIMTRNIVNDVLNGASGLTWRGGFSSTLRFLSWALPTSALELVVNGNRSVDLIKID
ncbi:NAD(P)-binding protein [Thozetella sp. PMI_491]|nr:NAD(P)-binding protein [Thozetella sp. PMI_491]